MINTVLAKWYDDGRTKVDDPNFWVNLNKFSIISVQMPITQTLEYFWPHRIKKGEGRGEGETVLSASPVAQSDSGVARDALAAAAAREAASAQASAGSLLRRRAAGESEPDTLVGAAGGGAERNIGEQAATWWESDGYLIKTLMNLCTQLAATPPCISYKKKEGGGVEEDTNMCCLFCVVMEDSEKNRNKMNQTNADAYIQLSKTTTDGILGDMKTVLHESSQYMDNFQQHMWDVKKKQLENERQNSKVVANIAVKSSAFLLAAAAPISAAYKAAGSFRGMVDVLSDQFFSGADAAENRTKLLANARAIGGAGLDMNGVKFNNINR